MALWDAIFNVDFGINNYGKNATEAGLNLRDSLPADVNDAIDTLTESGYADVSWQFEPVDADEFRTNFLRLKPGEESV